MKPERVLLVDDEPNLLRLLGAVLRSGGFQVTAATSSAAALALADEAWDVLVTDVSLTGMDGPALAERIAQRHPGLLVVLMSGYEFDRESICRRLPRCALLQKPFPPRAVLKTIADLAGAG